MEPELILFDFSGTLAFLKKQPDPERFFSFLRSLGIEIGTEKEKEVFISTFTNLLGEAKNWLDFGQQLLEEFPLKPERKQIRALADFLKENIVFQLYEDVKEIIKLPLKKAILSANARFLIEGLGLEGFAKIFTPKETKFLKPDPRAFLLVLSTLKVKPENAMMVGDEIERDLIPAKKLGMEAVLIDRENKIKNPPFSKISSLSELKKILIY